MGCKYSTVTNYAAFYMFLARLRGCRAVQRLAVSGKPAASL
ncbi:hypothetical protein ApDm4_0509 [Acetobacter pomorum]|nr:hypothetical protein ApDm4_0509 [Acetobacter pomorum]